MSPHQTYPVSELKSHYLNTFSDIHQFAFPPLQLHEFLLSNVSTPHLLELRHHFTKGSNLAVSI